MKIAVVGSGISGLGASLLLSQKHEVHLFESDSRLGGHAHTSTIRHNESSFNVDTGFLVYNELTYPHLKGLFGYLGVETVGSDMSLSIQVPSAGLEWSGDNLDTVFAQRKNLFRPRFYKLLFDILRFHRQAEFNRVMAKEMKWTVAELLKKRRYSDELVEWYILPMIAAIWSTPEKSMMDFPAETFLTFFLNHKLLQVKDRVQWRTVKNGSRNYVDRIAARLGHVHLGEKVQSVKKEGPGVRLVSSTRNEIFDKVVMATHAPLTAKIFQTESSEVRRLLGTFRTEANQAYLHTDTRFIPKSRKCWSSWNVQGNLNNPRNSKVALTYYLNRLQPLQTKDHMLLTLNPDDAPAKNLMEAEYQHPIFDRTAISAQKEVPAIQGIDGVYFAGAWTRYGFHEDGLLSAVKVAEHFSLGTPWT